MGEYKKDVFDEYLDLFKEPFPIYELGFNKEMCKKCIEKGKTAKELGYYKVHKDRYY